MNQDILIIRDSNSYRVLHGYLQLANKLSQHNEIVVDVKGEGKVKIIRTRQGFFAGQDNQQLPLMLN